MRTAFAAAAEDRLGILVCSLNVARPILDRAKLQIIIARRSLGQTTQIVLSQYGTTCKLPELPISIRCAAL